MNELDNNGNVLKISSTKLEKVGSMKIRNQMFSKKSNEDLADYLDPKAKN